MRLIFSVSSNRAWRFFSFSRDGAAATEHCGVVGEVIHVIGDDGIDSKLVEKESY